MRSVTGRAIPADDAVGTGTGTAPEAVVGGRITGADRAADAGIGITGTPSGVGVRGGGTGGTDGRDPTGVGASGGVVTAVGVMVRGRDAGVSVRGTGGGTAIGPDDGGTGNDDSDGSGRAPERPAGSPTPLGAATLPEASSWLPTGS